MAHELEVWKDGSASFVSARQHAWHRLGTVLPDQFDATQAMHHAKLGGWHVRKEPLTTTVLTTDGVTTLDVVDHYATVRTHPITGQPDILGVVGNAYTPIQNEEHAAVLDAVVDESGAHFETAGSLRGGRQVFLTMKLPTTMQIGGVDPVDLYLIASNSHDGTSAFRLSVSPVRVVCANTLALATSHARSTFAIRHTSGARGTIEQARHALRLTFAYSDAFQAAAEAMIAQAVTDQQFRDLIDTVWPVDEQSRRSQTLADTRRATLENLWTSAPTLDGIRGTKWAAYQAVTEYTDHIAPVSAAAADPLYARAERVATSAHLHDLKARAFDLIAAS